jgi:hypothetical protein
VSGFSTAAEPGLLAAAQEELSGLAAAAQLQSFLTRGHAAGVVPTDFTITDLHHLYEVFVANLRAAARYRPQPLDGEVVFYQASEALAGLAAFDPEGLRPFAGRGPAIVDVLGDHYSMLQDSSRRAPGAAPERGHGEVKQRQNTKRNPIQDEGRE